MCFLLRRHRDPPECSNLIYLISPHSHPHLSIRVSCHRNRHHLLSMNLKDCSYTVVGVNLIFHHMRILLIPFLRIVLTALEVFLCMSRYLTMKTHPYLHSNLASLPHRHNTRLHRNTDYRIIFYVLRTSSFNLNLNFSFILSTLLGIVIIVIL